MALLFLRMDEYGGQTLEIEGFNSDGYLVIDSWKFHPDWCKKVGAQKSLKWAICIFWDKINQMQVIGKIN